MNENAKFTVGDNVANRYTLTKFVNHYKDYGVYICEYDNLPFRAKIYNPNLSINETLYRLIKSCSSMNISGIIDSGIYRNCFCEIRPFYTKGPIIKSAPFKERFLLNEVIPTMTEILKTIHGKGIVHGRIRPENIFYSDFGHDIVLGDFGIDVTTEALPGGCFYPCFAEAGFMPPEFIDSGVISIEADYYALGITLFCLATGRHPYAALNEAEIKRRVCRERLDLPEDIDKRVGLIIRGLTVKRPEKRWGYNEVMQALAGTDVAVDEGLYDMAEEEITAAEKEAVVMTEEKPSDENETSQKMPLYAQYEAAPEPPSSAQSRKIRIKRYTKKPKPPEPPKPLFYSFLSESYDNIISLSEAMAMRWNSGVSHLYSGKISDFYRNVDSVIAEFSDECSEIENPDLGLFKFLYSVNPNLSLYWKGKHFNNLNDIADSIFLSKDLSPFEELLEYGVLSCYLMIKGEFARAEAVKKLESEIKSNKGNEKYTVYKLMYTLSEKPVFVFDGFGFKTPDDLADYLDDNISSISRLCERIIDDTAFYAWLDFLGYKEEFKEWENSWT